MGLLDRPGQSQRYGLLSPDVMSLIQSGGPRVPQAPAAPRRERVSGWRVFDRVLGGQTVSEGLDAERARMEAEAMRPQAQARMAQMRGMAESMGPAAMIAFETNPEAFGESLGMQYRPVTTAEGSITSYGPGDGARRVAAPVIERFDDRFGMFDPLNPQGGAQYSAPRGNTESERIAATVAETGRINATNPMNVAPGGQLRDPRTGALVASGAPRILAAPDATQLFTEDGGLLAENERDAPPVDPEQARRAAQSLSGRVTMADNLQTGLTGARQFVDSAGVWTHLMPWQRQARANLEGHLETIKGNISFERLMEMKANSPNGASGLGALSDREARMLANTVGALDAEMSPQELARSFATIDALVAKMREEAAPAAAPAAGAPVRIANDADYARLPSGATFVGPDGVTRRKP